MSAPVRTIVLAAVLLVLALFLGACFRAVRKSRELQRQYRHASPAERELLDARMLVEPELAEYMLPLPAQQVVLSFAGVAFLVWAKFSGLI